VFGGRGSEVSLISNYETQHACSYRDFGPELTPNMRLKNPWGCLSFGCSILWEDRPDRNGWTGRTNLINQDFGAFFRQPPEGGRGCYGTMCSPNFVKVCYKPVGLKQTLNDVYDSAGTGLKTRAWHLAEPGIKDCKSGRAP